MVPPSVMAYSLITRAVDDRYVIGEFGRVHLMVFRGKPGIDDLDVAERYHAPQRRRTGNQTSVLALVEPGTPLPGRAYQTHSQRMVARIGPSLKSSAIVIPDKGFGGSVYRSVLTTIFFVAKQPVPSKAFATSSDGALWTAEVQGDPKLVPADLAGALEALRDAR